MSTQAPYTSDYTFENIYFRSIQSRDTDYLTTAAYLWRWDTDWFWCSKNFGAQNPTVRRLLGRERLNSRFYTKVMRFNSRWRLTHLFDRLSGQHRESVIQDVDIPIERAPEFLDFFQREIGILPVWICPIRSWNPAHRWTMYPMDSAQNLRELRLLGCRAHAAIPAARPLQPPGGTESAGAGRDQVAVLGQLFSAGRVLGRLHGEAYHALKQRYDPGGVFKDLYAKCVLRA